MKVLVDMNFSPRWAELPIAAGFDALHWSRVGIGDAPDPEIMQYARIHGYVVFTNDLDFGIHLAATKGEKPSVIQIRGGELRLEMIGPQLVSAMLQMAEELEKGALLTFDPKRTRVSMLPLR
jgi:predicted nuclease of predicted toxin-antitoxin system